ncbi:hypothetical protein S1OALGB6SA_982 [Olavius algarvensis spirochete endosymbiont]|uniref:MvaI/BcnI family restriction endonuclease n=1 Tax=Olavius algarvensis spirochete endosymbiont TaxID=260710 RepID=UPI000F1C4C21|nr:MvaI/BcnI family restriction endonuclease [Olavius algarvensis spirochete endosymbiont]CAD7836882.1 MAG: hypothetical protein [Olavius algarvensis spirochete endosymbiont]VDA99908.1 hypothetical protein S1OALGB6SA_982 [Olavius algarvensis spirochete endosymbiont]
MVPASKTPLPPKSAMVTFKKIAEILDMREIEIPNERAYNGAGGPGRILEDLLGVNVNNSDSPDLADWEIKFYGGSALITLFHKDPEPRGIIRDVVHNYGWEDSKGRISFRHTIKGRSNRGFVIKNEHDRIVVRNELKDATVPHWNHDTLLNAVGAKLRRLILVAGEVRPNPRRVIFDSAKAYWEFNMMGFCGAVESGLVRIDFDARTNAGRGSSIRNHGTKFRVHSSDIGQLYKHSKTITQRIG